MESRRLQEAPAFRRLPGARSRPRGRPPSRARRPHWQLQPPLPRSRCRARHLLTCCCGHRPARARAQGGPHATKHRVALRQPPPPRSRGGLGRGRCPRPCRCRGHLLPFVFAGLTALALSLSLPGAAGTRRWGRPWPRRHQPLGRCDARLRVHLEYLESVEFMVVRRCPPDLDLDPTPPGQGPVRQSDACLSCCLRRHPPPSPGPSSSELVHVGPPSLSPLFGDFEFEFRTARICDCCLGT